VLNYNRRGVFTELSRSRSKIMYSMPSVPAIFSPGGTVPSQGAANNPMRAPAFAFAVILIFLRFSMVHQIQAQLMGVNLYLLYVFGIPALIGIFAIGGFQRTLQWRPGLYWTLFGVWLLVGVPFSSWRVASLGVVLTYFRTELLMMFIIAGAASKWRDCRKVMVAIALAAVISLAAAKLFSHVDDNQRMSLNFGTIANSNDYAGHLIFVLPFLLWVVMTSKTLVFRVAAFALIPYGLYVILSTASRGALIAIGVGAVYAFFAGSARIRIAMGVLLPLVFVVAISLLPQRAWQRLLSFSDDSTGNEEAVESTETRKYLLQTSLLFMVEHPLFGVGADQFSGVEGKASRQIGKLGVWHATHNSFTQVGSECGLPALYFFLAGIGSSLLLLNRVYRSSRDRPEYQEISATAFCLMLSLVSFCAAITFLNFGYFFYLPAMGGLAICVAKTAEEEFKKTGSAVPATAPVIQPVTPFVRRRAPQPNFPQKIVPPVRPTRLR